jgi:hypothetical protein
MATSIKTQAELLSIAKSNWLEQMRNQINSTLSGNYQHSINVDALAPWNYDTLIAEAEASGIIVTKNADGTLITFSLV